MSVSFLGSFPPFMLVLHIISKSTDSLSGLVGNKEPMRPDGALAPLRPRLRSLACLDSCISQRIGLKGVGRAGQIQ
jgi:hypothetical protein